MEFTLRQLLESLPDNVLDEVFVLKQHDPLFQAIDFMAKKRKDDRLTFSAPDTKEYWISTALQKTKRSAKMYVDNLGEITPKILAAIKSNSKRPVYILYRNWENPSWDPSETADIIDFRKAIGNYANSDTPLFSVFDGEMLWCQLPKEHWSQKEIAFGNFKAKESPEFEKSFDEAWMLIEKEYASRK